MKLSPLRAWSRRESSGAVSLFPDEHLGVLEEANLCDLVAHPARVQELKLEFERVGWGGKSRVYDINGTSILVKKHFPYFWSEGEFKDRRNTARAILANLATNVAFEQALRGNLDYTTPQYLGHLILPDARACMRHYTFMTKLRFTDSTRRNTKQTLRIHELMVNMPATCTRLLLAHGHNPLLVRWSEAQTWLNVVPVEVDGTEKVGIIDQESLLARYPRLRASVPIAYWEDTDPLIGNI